MQNSVASDDKLQANENAFRCTNDVAEQTDHATDCYFYLTNIKGFSRKNKVKVVYPNCSSAPKPFPHGNDLSVRLYSSPEELEILN